MQKKLSKNAQKCALTMRNLLATFQVKVLKKLSILQEFLKKEFSHENIYFWTACERYRKIKGDSEESVKVRMAAAAEILKRHLSSGAAEPVNVDSHARSAAHEGPPTSQLFSTAQKQIYNLMKFDSFSRFLKSELYKESLVAEMSGKNLPFENCEREALLGSIHKPRGKKSG